MREQGKTGKEPGALKKTLRMFSQIIPLMLGVLLFISLLKASVPPEAYSIVFTGNMVADSFTGAAVGSIAAGNPVTSYIIGGELQAAGVSLVAIIAFIVAWVTVGMLQLPAEMSMLGRGFALKRNAIAFVSSVIIAMLTMATLGVLA